jgi:hypothetical protein
MNTVKSTMLLPKAALLGLFEERGRMMKFEGGLTLDLYKKELVMVSLDLKANSDNYQMTLLTDYVAADEFINQYQLKRLDQIWQMDSGNIWMRYLAGQACVCMEIFELEAEICFRLVNGITIVYCRELHFYDEVYSTLSMVPQFEKYAVENRSKLDFAVERRWKW